MRKEYMASDRSSRVNRTYLKDENDIAPQALCSILCSSSCRNMNDPATYTPFRLFSAHVRQPIDWPEKTDTCCWWCCHRFDTVPTCVPALYSLEKRLFEVFGIFCSWNCAKAYVQSGYSSDSSEQLMWMRILAQEVFGCNIDELNAAPPRIFLTMFGGHLSIDEFRQKSHVATTALLHPPLVSYPMVLQELQLQQQQEQEDGGRQTSPGRQQRRRRLYRASQHGLSGRIMGLQRPTPRKPPAARGRSAQPAELHVRGVRAGQAGGGGDQLRRLSRRAAEAAGTARGGHTRRRRTRGAPGGGGAGGAGPGAFPPAAARRKKRLGGRGRPPPPPPQAPPRAGADPCSSTCAATRARARIRSYQAQHFLCFRQRREHARLPPRQLQARVFSAKA